MRTDTGQGGWQLGADDPVFPFAIEEPEELVLNLLDLKRGNRIPDDAFRADLARILVVSPTGLP